MAHIWLSHGTPMNETWHTYEWFMAHEWMIHCTHMNESWHRSCTHMNESWRRYEWVMAQTSMSQGTHINESYGVATASRIDKITSLFCKRACKRDDILQKRLIILSILLTEATTWHTICHGTWRPHKRVTAHLWIRHGTPMNYALPRI